MVKNNLKILIPILLIAFILLTLKNVNAAKGVGIVWSLESAIFDENKKNCITYGLYNPWDQDVEVILTAGKDLSKFVKPTKPIKIKAYTYHNNSIEVQLCFAIPKIYKKSCLLGNILCKQECNQEQIKYNGEIIAIEKKEKSKTAHTGSSTAVSASAPLKIKIRCKPHPTDLTILYIALIIIALIILTTFLYKAKPKEKREQEKLKKLEKKLKQMKEKLKKQWE